MDKVTGVSSFTFVVAEMFRAVTYGVEFVNKVRRATGIFTVD